MACRQHICADCSVNVDDLYYCKDCVIQMTNTNTQSPPMPPQGYYQGQGHSPQGNFNNFNANINNGQYYHGPIRRYRKSGFLLFLLSAIPGLNYMYLGLMKRGLFIMTLFFGAVFVAHEIGARILMFCIFILMCFSLFDGFRVRRLLIDGFVVQDASDDLIAFFKMHRTPIMLFLAAVLLFGFAGRVVRGGALAVSMGLGSAFGAATSVFSFLAGLLVIVIGCYIVARLISRRGGDEQG